MVRVRVTVRVRVRVLVRWCDRAAIAGSLASCRALLSRAVRVRVK